MPRTKSVADYVHKHKSKHNDVGLVGKCANLARKESCRLDLRLFLQTYHAATCLWPFSEAHLRYIADLQHVILNGGRKAIAIPRGCGKTSIAMGAVEWALLYGHRRFVVVLGATQDAADNLIKAIFADFESIDVLYADFPAICKPFRHLAGVKQRTKAQHQNGTSTDIGLTASELVLPYAKEDGADSFDKACGGRVYAAGLTGHIRGLFRVPREGGRIRPDFVLPDDPQTRDSAKSETQTLQRIRLIDGDVMRLAGHGRDIAAVMPCTVIARGDLAEHYLAEPNWQGQRTRAVELWPSGAASFEDIPEAQLSLIDEYKSRWLAEITKAAPEGTAGAWYLANREAIESGSRVFWDAMFDHVKEVSAFQHCLHLLWSDGAYSFAAEMQQEPQSDRPEAEYTLTADAIRKQIGAHQRGEIPQGAAAVTAFVDLNYHAAAWCVVAATNEPCYSVVDYGWYVPARGQPLWQEGHKQALETTIYRACESVVAMILSATYGKQITAIAIDCGSKWASTVHAACKMLAVRNAPVPIYAAKGFSSSMYREPYRRQTIKKRGFCADIRFLAIDREQMMQWDSHKWHMITQRGWLIPIGMAGSVCLFNGGTRMTHAQFAEEASADKLEGVVEKNGKMVAEWKTTGRNEAGDVLAGAAALLSTEGVRPDSADDSKQARRAAKKARQAELRAENKSAQVGSVTPVAQMPIVSEQKKPVKMLMRPRGGFATRF